MAKPTTLSFPEVDWSHPAFKGRRAIVIVGGKRVTEGKGELDYIVNAVASSSRIDASAKGIAWHGTGVGTKLNLSRVLGEHASALVIMDSGSIRTNRTAVNNLYIGYISISNTGVIFGTGGGIASSSRRSWSWTGGYATCIVPHATNPANAPLVYVDGARAVPTDAGGTATSVSWGTASTDVHEVGYNPGSPTTNQNDKVVLAVFFSGALPEALAKSLSENPWQLFKKNAPALYFSASGSANTVSPGAGGIAVAGQAPTISQPHTVSPAAGAVSVTGYAPSLAQGVSVAPGAGGIAVAGQAPTISQPHTVSPAAGAVSVAGYAPSLVQGVSVAPGAGSVAYAGQTPSIAQPHTVTPSTGAVTVLGYAPAIQQAAGIYPGAGEVVYTGQAPTVGQPHTVSPGVGAYDILGYAHVVSQAATIAQLAGSIIVLGYAPGIAQPITISPGAGAAVWLGQTPTISQEAMTLTPADLDAIAAAVWADPSAVAAHAKLDEIIARITC